jgi:PASTA domain
LGDVYQAGVTHIYIKNRSSDSSNPQSDSTFIASNLACIKSALADGNAATSLIKRLSMSNIRNVITNILGGVFLALMLAADLTAQVAPIPAPAFLPMGSDITINSSPYYTVLVGTNVKLAAGEMRRIFGRAEIASTTGSSGSGSVVEAYTLCIGPDGTESQLGGAEQNYKGKSTPVGSNYPFPGELALYPLLLFQAPTSGFYTCELRAQAEPGLSAVARAPDGSSTTWLQISAAISGAIGGAISDPGAPWWQNLGCDEFGNYDPASGSWCLYLDGASNLQQLYVFQNDGSPAKAWKAPDDAAFVSASDSLMLTTCDYGTKSCTKDNSQSKWSKYWWDIGVDGTYVDTHLELTQLDAARGVCKVTPSYEQRSFVDNASHHNMIYHSLSNVPVDPECGSRLFTLRMSVKYVTGIPVKIDGWTWTHAYAFESFSSPSGSAPAIPNLAGLTEGAASANLTATGYAVGTVSSALNAAPAGIVLSQNPAAGIIESPGSPVNFTVSTGGKYVPDLLSLPQSGATSAITRLGLVPSISSTRACINPGDVLTQGPAAGTLVAPGSTVHITIDSGTYKNCVLK